MEGRSGFLSSEPEVGRPREPDLADVREALITLYGTDFGVHSPIWISRFTDMSRQAASYATAGSCWPATPPTSTRRPVVRDSTPVSRIP